MIDKREKRDHRYAGLWRRFLALLIDFILFSAFFFPITRIVKGTWLMGVHDHRWIAGWIVTDPLCLIFLVIIVLYFVILEGFTGATPGKWTVHIRVIGPGGGKPGLVKSAVRNGLRIVDSLPFLNILGIILISRSNERARYGDRIAGTRVIVVESIDKRQE